MKEINNYFYSGINESLEVTFDSATKKITGIFTNTYIVGMYIKIKGTFLNDGVYKIVEVDVNELTVSEDLQDEVAESCIAILKPCKAFLSLVAEIETYVASGNKEGISSEKIDDYAVSYGSGNGGWSSVFKKRLNTYRKLSWC